jgi:hypothetical protein
MADPTREELKSILTAAIAQSHVHDARHVEQIPASASKILERFVKELRLEDLEGIRDRIQESDSGPSAVRRFGEASSPMGA